MPIAITDDHRSLGETAADFLAKHEALGAARALLDGAAETLPAFWTDLCELGWLGLHIPEEHGGSGYGLSELIVVIEELGRVLAPGPFVPSALAAAVIAASAPAALQAGFLPGLAAGTMIGAAALSADAELRDGKLHGSAVVIGGGLADVILVPVGDDVVAIEAKGAGVTITSPQSLDPSRRAVRVTFDGAAADLLPGAARSLTDLSRVLFGAEAVGITGATTLMAADYAKARLQFGRPIAMYQSVKHHCANMAVSHELSTAAVWDAARASVDGGDTFSLTAAIVGTLAFKAAEWNAQLNTQVHGGIGFTWEHDCHLYLRRATSMYALMDVEGASRDAVDLVRAGAKREKTIELPPEAEAMRTEAAAYAQSVVGKTDDEKKASMIETGYVMPHWPLPYGRAAGAIEQLVIEEEFAKAGVKRPGYGITGWVILTLIQYGTAEQVSRWVLPALRHDVIWCQLFSEPDAGSDAAGIKTKATRVDGGWLVNGQKVWTSGAHVAGMGFATVRTNPDVPKHSGITTMVIDMKAEGVEVRRLKMPTGNSEFNEVFFNDVFVPDDDVIGSVDSGWTVARATLGNESVSIGSGDGGMSLPPTVLINAYDAHPARLNGGAARIGRYIANYQSMGMLNLRTIVRAVNAGGPGPEGAITKLVLSEVGHEAAGILTEVAGPEAAFLEGEGAMAGMLALTHRGMSIAGGTSEIKRNQIGERILGLPRDPLIN